MKGRLLLVVAVIALLGTLAPTAVAAAEPTFGTPTATSKFDVGIDFNQPFHADGALSRAELLLTFADAIGPSVVEVPLTATNGETLSYKLETAGQRHLIPNTAIKARWRIFPASDPEHGVLGPELRTVYADDRFDWKTVSGDLVRVHWYEGSDGFAAKALKLGEDEVRDTSKLLGVTETEPVDFFVYANHDDFYGALGPGAHENVAGTAFANIRTLLGLIPPGDIDDPLVAVRIPHEFVHLVFDTASSNPYHFPPRWLNEGLAVYQSEGYGSDDRGAVEQAARAGTLIPLDGLTGEFPNGEDFFLAYSESVGAVDYMIRTHGADALVKLIRSYAQGRTDDEAFTAALGVDMTAFGQAWFNEVKAKAPTRYGPQPAPPGPVPAAWGGVAGGAGAAAVPGETSKAPPAVGATAAADPVAVPNGTSDRSSGVLILAVVAIIAIVAIAFLVARRRRRPTDPAG
ncbi:MAG: peptidase MA family metallohydrolase [Chloroflexota bacterium]